MPSDAEQALQEMVGLTRLKEDLQEARMMAAFMKRRMELGLDTELDNRHHMLFLGNPGTGKTTVAKLIGQLYHQMGLLSSGHTIETCRTKLVGEYIGETEKHIRQAIEEARGGVLFIDEAYTLITTKQETKDFGKEVIHALLTVLSEPNPDMIIILAGYEDKMQQMLDDWNHYIDEFIQVVPIEYKRVLQEEQVKKLQQKIADMQRDY
jgi:stage V sporulation protein K